MIVERVDSRPFFRAVDGCEIVEVIGLATTGTREDSLALAKIHPGTSTLPHWHDFLEIYMVVGGKGIMHLGGEKRSVRRGDNILIPPKTPHWVENGGGRSTLLIWCVCTPAFTEDGTTLEG